MEPIATILHAKPEDIFHWSFNITLSLKLELVLKLEVRLVMSQTMGFKDAHLLNLEAMEQTRSFYPLSTLF